MVGQIGIPLGTLALIIRKARSWDARVAPDVVERDFALADDWDVSVLEGSHGNAKDLELMATLKELKDEQLTELLALLWVGRGSYDRTSWKDAVSRAHEVRNRPVVRYLISTPMLGDLVEEGLARLGFVLPLLEEGAS